MKSEKTIFIFVGFIILIVGAYFYISNSKNYKWNESYATEDQHPYGVYALTELLKESYKVKIIDKPLNKYHFSTGNYFYIGNYIDIDSLQRKKLLSYVNQGNKAYILTTIFPYDLIDHLKQLECEKDTIDTFKTKNVPKIKAELRFSKLKSSIRTIYKFQYVVKNKPKDYTWAYVDTSEFCRPQKIEVLGTIDGSHINYYRIKYGKGEFIFHTNPIIFTNYF
jgi:hypothetical protein